MRINEKLFDTLSKKLGEDNILLIAQHMRDFGLNK